MNGPASLTRALPISLRRSLIRPFFLVPSPLVPRLPARPASDDLGCDNRIGRSHPAWLSSLVRRPLGLQLIAALFLSCGLPGGTRGALALTIGNDPVGGGTVDGWSAILVVNENDTYTNTTAAPQTLTLTEFNFNAGAARGRLTPFVASVNGDNDFLVVAVGRTRVASTDYPVTGIHHAAFADGAPRITLNPGETIAPGYTDANPDGTGNGGSVIPFGDGGDEIWLTGGSAATDAGRVSPGATPVAGTSTYATLTRQYAFSIGFTIAATLPLPPTGINLSTLALFPGLTPGSRVGTLATIDPNDGDTHQYFLENDAAGVFAVEGAVLRTVQPLGEAGTTYPLRVRSTDQTGRSLEQDFSLTVIAPHPPLSLMTTATSILHGTAAGALVGHLITLDPDPEDAHSHLLVGGPGDGDNGNFLLTGDELRLASPIPADRTTLSLRVRTTDRAGLLLETVISLSVSEAGLRLNEFLASNDTGLRDEEGVRQDWIELHNPSATAVDLLGWRLTDDPGDLAQWVFPAHILAPGGYLVVFASGNNRVPAGGTLHTNFRIDGSRGDFLALVRPDGVVADSFAAREQFTDLAYGRGVDGPGQGYLTPTPDAPNGAAFPFGLNEVHFSVKRGFYTGTQVLALTADVPGSVIRYTTNGSLPTATSGLVYEGPLTLTPDTAGATRGTRRLRAAAIQAEAAANRVGTHTYLFVNGVIAPATDGLVSQTNSNSSTQTTAIKNHATYGPLMDDALTALPAVCITNLPGLPGASETRASVEFFHPSGTEPGFQIDCGIQAVGGHSIGSPKNNFRLYFRSQYGKSSLNHNIFRDHPYTQFHQPAESFDRIALRSCSHDSFFWMAEPSTPPMAGLKGDALYLRGLVMDDLHLNMGHAAPHNRYVQLWLNGRYHGLYHWREYPNNDFMASYHPGSNGDFDFTNGANPGENGSATWQATWAKLRTAVATSHAEAARWIDLPQFADFMILNFWAGNAWDWNPNQNWMAAGPKLPDRGGWNFFSYDNDVIWNDPAANLTIPTSPYYVNTPRPGIMPPDGLMVTTPTTDITLMDYPEFRILFRDRFYKACYHGGPLETARAQAILDHRVQEVFLPLIAETARWQPASATALPWDRNGEWMAEVNRIRNSFIPSRCATLLGQIKARGWYPVDPPEFAQHGGSVPPGTQPAVTSLTAGTAVYATLDGSDPRLPGGGINPTALLLTEPPPAAFAVAGPALIRLRARRASDAEWSALNEAVFHTGILVPAGPDTLVISEIHYHPEASAGPGDGEFVEFMNVSANLIDLGGCYFTRGLDFVFAQGTTLFPGQRLVIKGAQFLNGTSLSDGGERLTLVQPGGTIIRDFSYSDELPWPPQADGTGYSLVLRAPAAAEATDASQGDGLNWRASSAVGGNPGTADGISFAAWKSSHGLMDDTDDRDGDGLTALMEYATGSDPATHGTANLPMIRPAPGGPELWMWSGVGLTGVALYLESSGNLTNWHPATAPVTAREQTATAEKIIFALPQEAPGRFWRLRASTAP